MTFPVYIWILETLKEYHMLLLLGRNQPCAFINAGNILHGKLDVPYLCKWIIVGIVLEFAWEPVVIPLANAMHPFLVPYLILVTSCMLAFSADLNFAFFVTGWSNISDSDKRPWRVAIVACLWYYWFYYVSPIQRGLTFLAAPVYALIETTFTTLRHEDENNTPIYGWTGEFGHTTFVQFWANMLYLPILLHYYRDVVPPALYPGYVRVLLFPFNIWLLEIIEGYFIMFLFDYNVAWDYGDAWDSHFNGNIKLSYYFFWAALGAVIEVGYEPFMLPMAEVLAPHTTVFLSCAVILTLLFSHDLGWRKLKAWL